jgi:hypothetical protein
MEWKARKDKLLWVLIRAENNVSLSRVKSNYFSMEKIHPYQCV